jgi:hypothetical protein
MIISTPLVQYPWSGRGGQQPKLWVKRSRRGSLRWRFRWPCVPRSPGHADGGADMTHTLGQLPHRGTPANMITRTVEPCSHVFLT